MPALKNMKWELYCQGIVQGKTSDKSYEDAGYVQNRKNAARLKSNEVISIRIKELQEAAVDEHGITVGRILKEYERLAFSDVRDLVDDEGRPLAPHELGDDAAASVAGFEYSFVRDEAGEAIGSMVKVKMTNKHPPLKDLAQMFGLVESEGGTKIVNNTQINVNVTPTEKVRAIAAAFAKVSNE